MVSSVVSICVGGSLGCLLRWVLGSQLNHWYPALPPGTLAANLLGGFLIGVAIAFLAAHPALPPQWRLFVVTGFLGGLTTFSTFSAEVASQIAEGRTLWAAAAVMVHVVGSVAMTLLGMGAVALLRSFQSPGG